MVHISSSVALMRHGGSGPDLPLGDIDHAYSKSKVLSEEVGPRVPGRGKPVVTVYPGAIYGPHDPYVGSQTERFLWMVRGPVPDLVQGRRARQRRPRHRRRRGGGHGARQGPRRYVVPGIHMTGKELYAAVAKAIGRRRPYVEVPARFGALVEQG